MHRKIAPSFIAKQDGILDEGIAAAAASASSITLLLQPAPLRFFFHAAPQLLTPIHMPHAPLQAAVAARRLLAAQRSHSAHIGQGRKRAAIILAAQRS